MIAVLVLSFIINQQKVVEVAPYTDAQFIYYTITSEMTGGWAMTGFKSRVHPERGIRWMTAAHYFPVSMKPQVIGTDINGENLFINEVASLGNDVCIFTFGGDSTFIVKGFSDRGPRDSYEAEMDISIFDQPDEAFYLVDNMHYQVIGSIVVEDPLGAVEGFLVDKGSQPGDCGTGFIYEGQLSIVTKSIPAGLSMPNGIVLGDLTVIVRFRLTP